MYVNDPLMCICVLCVRMTGIGTSAALDWAFGVCFNSDMSTLYVTDHYSIRAMRMSDFSVTRIAGHHAGEGMQDGYGTNAKFTGARSCAIDPATNIMYIAEFS